AAFCGAVPATLTVERSDETRGCGFCTNSGGQGPPGHVSHTLSVTITASNTPTLFNAGDSFLLTYGPVPDAFAQGCGAFPCYFFTENYSGWSGFYNSPSFGQLLFVLSPDKSSTGSYQTYMTILGCSDRTS